MPDPGQLRRQRAAHRAVARHKIIEVEDAFTASATPDALQLEQLKKGLKETYEKLNKLDEDLMPHVDPGDIDKEIEDSEQIKDDLFAVMAKVEHVLAAALPAVSTSIAPVTATPAAAAPHHTKTKLPKLKIKNFSGNITGWSPFWGMYKSSVHDNTSLSNIEKFSYLQSLLVGKAQEAIAGMSLTDANYTAAIDLLQRRFGDKERTIAAHMDNLMSLEPVASEHHLLDLRRLYDGTESSIRSLEALGVRAAIWSIINSSFYEEIALRA